MWFEKQWKWLCTSETGSALKQSVEMQQRLQEEMTQLKITHKTTGSSKANRLWVGKDKELELLDLSKIPLSLA